MLGRDFSKKRPLRISIEEKTNSNSAHKMANTGLPELSLGTQRLQQESDQETESDPEFQKRFYNKETAAAKKKPKRVRTSMSHQCQICSMIVCTKSHLQRHMRIHYGFKPYACLYPGCKKRFARRDNMSQHFASHTTMKRTYSKPLRQEDHESDIDCGLNLALETDSDAATLFWNLVKEASF
ncbi:hypothetical protein BDR26DRAFT_874532 [Obelidium mucronatum]|nr:hypothetical protein BDR26DRAFT_874532 [Obelidium mucronatum]